MDQQQNPSSSPPPGPPYLPQNAALGGIPNNPVDTPITAVFLVLFILGAVAHMSILQINRKRGHKFILSGLLFGFCMARITAMVMRIVWANRTNNPSIAIAAQVFTNAGVVLLFIVNLVFTQRVLRAAHPNSGWHPLFRFFFHGLYAVVVISLFLLIAFIVVQFYTLDPTLRRNARDVLWYGLSYFLFTAFIPIPLIIGGLILPRSTRVEKFGTGRYRSKIAILLFSSTILTLGAAFRASNNFEPPRPRNAPAWYDSKACFYCFNFMIEIIVVLLYVAVRVDLRFHVPNGSKKAGDYSRGRNLATIALEKEQNISNGGTPEEGQRTGPSPRIMSEEEVFDDIPEERLRKSVEGDVEANGGQKG